MSLYNVIGSNLAVINRQLCRLSHAATSRSQTMCVQSTCNNHCQNTCHLNHHAVNQQTGVRMSHCCTVNRQESEHTVTSGTGHCNTPSLVNRQAVRTHLITDRCKNTKRQCYSHRSTCHCTHVIGQNKSTDRMSHTATT